MRFHRATTLDEALDLLAKEGDQARILAGGTDVMVQYQRGEISPESLVHIEGIAGLDGVAISNGSLSMGALVTHRRVRTEPDLAGSLPALAEACATVGGWQTQEVGTVAGNVCNASPAADTIPPLLVADARVELRSITGKRLLPLADFILGRRQTACRPDEMVTAIEVESLPTNSSEVYLKVAPRSGMEVALVGLALRLTLSGDQVEDARIAVCATSEVPFRAGEAESILASEGLGADALGEAGARLAAASSPIDDHRASAAYRRRVLSPLLARAVDIARQRLEGAE